MSFFKKSYKQFRVLNIIEDRDLHSGLDMYIIELVQITNINKKKIDLKAYMFEGEGTCFIFLRDSTIANEIIRNPEEIVKINPNDFRHAKITGRGVEREAYYDYDYENARNEILRSKGLIF